MKEIIEGIGSLVIILLVIIFILKGCIDSTPQEKSSDIKIYNHAKAVKVLGLEMDESLVNVKNKYNLTLDNNYYDHLPKDTQTYTIKAQDVNFDGFNCDDIELMQGRCDVVVVFYPTSENNLKLGLVSFWATDYAQKQMIIELRKKYKFEENDGWFAAKCTADSIDCDNRLENVWLNTYYYIVTFTSFEYKKYLLEQKEKDTIAKEIAEKEEQEKIKQQTSENF